MQARGSPYPVFNADWRWNEVDPSQHMGVLAEAGVGVSVYVGDGGGSPLEPEFWVAGAAKNVKAAMDALGQMRTITEVERLSGVKIA